LAQCYLRAARAFCGARIGKTRSNYPLQAMAKAPVKPEPANQMRPAEQEHPGIAPLVGPDDPRRFTDSGIEIQPLYDDEDLAGIDLEERLGKPGEYPFTRGIHPEMYRSRRWTMRQYAGYASARETNTRFRYLLEHGSTGLSMAFDLPTQLGRDSDDPRCLGEVGRTGVAIDSIDDMRTVFDQIPLDKVSTSMTINAPASVLLLLYELVGEEQGVPSAQLRGTVQNDILKEYAARGNFIYPPEGAMRLTTDVFAYCNKHVPKWNTISISGYHMREKGCSAVQEVAFTLSNGIAYVQAAIDAGLEVDDFAPQIAFFFNGHNNVFQEIAKFRAVRRMWAEIMRDRYGAQNPRSQMVRFHTQTGGSTLTAQQPENNIIRVALQGFAAVCGGTQSLHTNGFDEALGLPTERSAKIALRTQQVIAHESGAADTVDPLAGSYYVESLTDEIERQAGELMAKVEELGGSVHAIEQGFIQREIEDSAFAYHRRLQTKQDVLVGVNEYAEDEQVDVEILKIDPESEREQVDRLKRLKENRDREAIAARLQDLRDVALGDGNLLYPLKDALRDRCTIGEVCGVMREVFGEYRAPV
jgi:methylmalonyl-CoA mutase, N-terminal domain